MLKAIDEQKGEPRENDKDEEVVLWSDQTGPYQSIPTASFIDHKSVTHDVRHFLTELLQAIDSRVTTNKALELADKFDGTG